MGAIGDLIGRNGVIEQLVLWNVVGKVMDAMMSPAFIALQQDVLKEHPNAVLTPDIVARAVVQQFMDKAAGEVEAAKSGIDPSRFDIMLKLADIRLQPADLALAVLRSYMTEDAAIAEAAKQGVTEGRFRILKDLSGDAPGPQQLAEAERRGIIPRDGTGPDAVSYRQGIAESRLHDKWAGILLDLERALLSPQAAAEAVVRGFLAADAGEHVASLSGVDARQFRTMVDLAGDAPAPGQLAEALRRDVIPYDSGSPDKPGFLQGIREGRLADKWAPLIRELSKLFPTPTDALEALLVGQVTEQDARDLYAVFGGEPKYFDLLFHTRGESPTPLELITLANRGDIDWDGRGADAVTYEQGFHEGRWRNKWEPVYRKLAHYEPPESTVVTLLAHGTIDAAQATVLLKRQGMDDELIHAYIDEAHTEALSDYRGATVSMVLQAYYRQMISADQAEPILESLHVTKTAAQFMLTYEDLQRAFTAIDNALSRIRTLFAARKITLETARNALTELGIPPVAIEGVLKSWEIENSVSVKVLTEAQIVDAWEAQILTDAEAITELTNIGYTPFDAWVLMSVKHKGPIPGKPAKGPSPPQNQVVGGTT